MKALRPLLIALALLCPALAMAQDFPNKTIRLIVPFPPGGPNDIIARVVGQRMSEILKQTIVIDNRSGQGGVVGTDVVAKSAPDGYTIGIASAGALAISPSMEKVAYDTLKDLQPITLVAKVPEMLVVATSVPAKRHERIGCVGQGATWQTQLRIIRSRQHATSRRRTFQAHRRHQYRACPLSRRGSRRERPARPAGADGVPRFTGAAAANQSRQTQADCGRHHATGAERPRCADHCRSRHGQSANRKLVRHGRTGQDTPTDRRHTQQGRSRSNEGSRTWSRS